MSKKKQKTMQFDVLVIKIKLPLVAIFALSTYLVACNSSDSKIKSSDSEMTLLMRKMYDDLEKVKMDSFDMKDLDHGQILVARTTELEKGESVEFKSFSKIYLNHLEIYKRSSEGKTHIKPIVENCISCHRKFCPGPISKIKKLLK